MQSAKAGPPRSSGYEYRHVAVDNSNPKIEFHFPRFRIPNLAFRSAPAGDAVVELRIRDLSIRCDSGLGSKSMED